VRLLKISPRTIRPPPSPVPSVRNTAHVVFFAAPEKNSARVKTLASLSMNTAIPVAFCSFSLRG